MGTGSAGQWSCGAECVFPDTIHATGGTQEWIHRSPTGSTVDSRFNELGNRNGKLEEFCTDNVWIAPRCAWLNIHYWNSRKFNVLNMGSILNEQRKANGTYWLFADLLSLNKVKCVWCTIIWVNEETECKGRNCPSCLRRGNYSHSKCSGRFWEMTIFQERCVLRDWWSTNTIWGRGVQSPRII